MDDILLLVKAESFNVLDLIENLARRFDYQTGEIDLEDAAVRAADLVFHMVKSGVLKINKHNGAITAGGLEEYGHPAYVS